MLVVIHDYAKEGHLAGVRREIRAGTNIDVKNKYSETALHFASYYGLVDVVHYLVVQ